MNDAPVLEPTDPKVRLIRIVLLNRDNTVGKVLGTFDPAYDGQLDGATRMLYKALARRPYADMVNQDGIGINWRWQDFEAWKNGGLG